MSESEQHGQREPELEWDQEDGRTLSTFPVSLIGCDAPMKLRIRAELTRGDTDSVDISKVMCGMGRGQLSTVQYKGDATRRAKLYSKRISSPSTHGDPRPDRRSSLHGRRHRCPCLVLLLYCTIGFTLYEVGDKPPLDGNFYTAQYHRSFLNNPSHSLRALATVYSQHLKSQCHTSDKTRIVQ